MTSKLTKGILIVFLANIINLVFNLLTNFLLPKYLSIESYAAIKTFQLYTTYVGVFALGCADGMYLRYGGIKAEDIDKNRLKDELYSFRIFMILQSLFLIPLSFWTKDKIVIGFTLTILSMNMIGYFKNLYQAIGEFKSYGKILNITTIATFVFNMGLLFVFKIDNYFIYLISYAIINLFIWILLEYNTLKTFRQLRKPRFLKETIIGDIQSGFLLMVGNFSNILLSSLDRWFVKILMTSLEFAHYSFAISMEGFLNIAITPVTTTLYNYFCIHKGKEAVKQVRQYVELLGMVIVVAAFPAKFILERYLQDYMGAIDVLFILFSSQIFYIVIKGVYVNLYKATKKQNLYFIRLVSVIFVGAILNYIFYKIYPYKESFSYGTLLSAIIWMTLCVLDFRDYGIQYKEIIFLISNTVIFILCGKLFSSIIGMIIYVVFTIMNMVVFMRVVLKNIIHSILSLKKNN